MGQGSFGTWHILPSISMVDSVACLRYAECSRAPDYITNIGFLGRWGTYACPQCLPSDMVRYTLSLSEAGPGRFGRQVSVTDICHTIPCHTIPCHDLQLMFLSHLIGSMPLYMWPRNCF